MPPNLKTKTKGICLATVTPDLARSISDKIMEEVSDDSFVSNTNESVVALLSKISLAFNS